MGEPRSPNRSLLRFSQFTSFVNSSFWFKFADLKLDEDKLEEVTRQIWGYYSHVERVGTLTVDCTSFNQEPDTCSSNLIGHGHHLNKNTIERFKDCDKNELLSRYGEDLYERMKTGTCVDDPSKLVSFILLTFADLKKYVFHYWFAFPAISDYRYFMYESPKNLETFLDADQIRSLAQSHRTLPENQKGFFCFKLNGNDVRLFSIKEFIADSGARENAFVAFLDPTPLQDIPGWPLRNLLSLFQIQCPEIFCKPLKVVSIRSVASNWNSNSIVFVVQKAEKAENFDQRQYLGWEKNLKGKFSPRLVNLSDAMDPSKLSSRAVNLNLKLVKWRLQPDLNLEILRNTSCLLLGAGTLGCSVSRVLVAWGIEKITFVDSGHVSYSNPVRQSLYTFADSLNNVYKAKTATAAMKLIHPGVNTEGEVLHIASPGCGEYSLDQVNRLQELIDAHDVTFLLTDSRESRWLPTLMCAAKKKIAITVALGYDSYLVMRHGVEGDDGEEKKKLGCYFCNDVVAPGNSKVDRTLDQQCTVTRPGLSSIAAAYGVELLIALLQHPERGLVGSDGVSCLGKIPHSIRGFLADHEFMYPATPGFEHCIACSSLVIDKYREEGVNFLKNVFSNVKYLEDVTTLSQYQEVDDEMEVSGFFNLLSA